MQFAKEMIETAEKLKNFGHEVKVPADTDKYASEEISHEDKWSKIENDVIKDWKEVIDNSDAILVVNHEKRGVKGYIGGNGLIEMAFAHVANKKIFLLNQIPELNYKDEILAMNPVVINGDLSLIKQ